MGFLSKIRNSNFWIKFTHWEFWPFEVVYFPLTFYWLWLSIKARSPFFFAASNPGIEYGGMLGERKSRIMELIPCDMKPVTILIQYPAVSEKVFQTIKEHSLSYPLILKPDIGERGFMVKKVENDRDVIEYLDAISQDFLIQEFLDAPTELGVFYYRYPDRNKGVVSSIVMKEMLTVTGNGTSTLKELIYNSPRAKLQLDVLNETIPDQMTRIPAKGESVELVPYGNHCRGAKFLDGAHLINDELNQMFDSIANKISGFYFGRFDIRCYSIEDLYKGNFKIMELNGAGAEPAHIYQPGASIFSAYKSLLHHLDALYQISKINRKRGVPYLSMKEGWYVVNQIPFIKNIKKVFATNQ